MSVTRLSRAGNSRYLRYPGAEVARRQLEMSVGLMVILLIGLLVGPFVLSHGKAPQFTANATAAATSMKPDAAARTPVRVIPIYSSQALSQTSSSRRS
jgi:hypothetical protein